MPLFVPTGEQKSLRRSIYMGPKPKQGQLLALALSPRCSSLKNMFLTVAIL